MESPYMKCPYASQLQGMVNLPQPTGYPMQQCPMQQYPQQFMTMPQGYPMMQAPYGMYDEFDAEETGPLTKSPGDPPPKLSNNPVSATVVLFKELTAYPNYGNPSRNCDILYTGNSGTWTFNAPPFLSVPGNLRGQIIIRAVLDDHASVPVNRYSARITINGTVVHDGRLLLEHGTPAGGIFTNWREIPFNIANQRRVTRVTIQNTSTAGLDDWIGLDWMELRSVPR